jgi:nitrite reductase/ring-hydroxylating ferredoxin subunit
MRLCHLDEISDGGSRGFDPHRCGHDTVLLVRRGRSLRAYADACPHHGTPMAWRKDAYLNGDRDRIVCAAHGAQFDIDTGLCTLGPCLGESLTPVPVTLHPDGEIHLASATSFQEETLP